MGNELSLPGEPSPERSFKPLPPLPITKTRIKKLGKVMRSGVLFTPDQQAGYDAILEHWKLVELELRQILAELPYDAIGVPHPAITSRVKTRRTTTEKLMRDPTLQLDRMQDIIGLRLTADMTLSQQDEVRDLVVGRFGDEVWDVKDRRANDSHGYRAIHVIISHRGVFAEVQIRTYLQDMWANTYELAGDILGREIRYGANLEDPNAELLASIMRDVSTTQIALLEGYHQQIHDLEHSSGQRNRLKLALQKRLMKSTRTLTAREMAAVTDSLKSMRGAAPDEADTRRVPSPKRQDGISGV